MSTMLRSAAALANASVRCKTKTSTSTASFVRRRPGWQASCELQATRGNIGNTSNFATHRIQRSVAGNAIVRRVQERWQDKSYIMRWHGQSLCQFSTERMVGISNEEVLAVEAREGSEVSNTSKGSQESMAATVKEGNVTERDNFQKSTGEDINLPPLRKERLSPSELSQLYDLLHLQKYTLDEIQNLTDAIVMSTSEHPSQDCEDETVACLMDATTATTLSKGEDLDHVTPQKLSNLLQSRILQEMEDPNIDSKPNTGNYGIKTSAMDPHRTFSLPSRTQERYNIESQSDLENRVHWYASDMSHRFLQYHILPQFDRTHVPLSDTSTLTHNPLSITKDEFANNLEAMVTNVDYPRVWPISFSMLLVGSSVGVIVPLMPFVAERMALSPGDYGLAISAFALSKLFGNLPSAIMCERYGRKPFMVYSLNLVALGVGGIGLATQVEHLIACRLLTGFGVAALSTAATLTIADISTPRNRAATLAPMNSSFAAGMALGPAIGGLLGDYAGVDNTFLMVGVSYLGVVALNSYLLSETKRDMRPGVYPWLDLPPTSDTLIKLKRSKANVGKSETGKDDTPSLSSSVQDAAGQWMPLMRNTRVRRIVTLNMFYWCALSGAQMTLLPLMLTNADGMALSAGMLGQVYMGMSLVQVLGNPSVAKMIDRVGKVPSIVGGCTALSAGMFMMPFCEDTTQLAAVLAVWTLGSTALSTAPFAYLADAVPVEKRAQALALLRTGGDVGFLLGATCTGALADWTGDMSVAMQACSGILLTGTGWFAARQLLAKRIASSTAPPSSVTASPSSQPPSRR
jgi:MFS family permease